MKKPHVLAFLFAISFFANLTAQQDPQYTQYMYNLAVINPAYAGSKNYLEVTSLYRNQWSGFKGAPKTITVSGHSAIGQKLGLGLSVISDQHGPVKEDNIYIDFSYTLKISDKHQLALGTKAGITVHDIGLANVQIPDSNDPFFSQNINKINPNIGIGTFLYSDNYYVGLSIPNLFKGLHLDESDTKFGSEKLHYFVTAGYVMQLTEEIKFKPSLLLKSEYESPVSFDINANFLFFEKLELGVSYRYQDAFSGLINFPLTKYIKAGYAYDYILSDIRFAAPGSHEIFLQFNLNFSSRVSRSPRFF